MVTILPIHQALCRMAMEWEAEHAALNTILVIGSVGMGGETVAINSTMAMGIWWFRIAADANEPKITVTL